MRRLIFAVFLAITILFLMAFVFSNSDAGTFGLPVTLKLFIPPFVEAYFDPIPLGYILMACFCLGMVTTPFFEALPSFYKSLELRAKNKRIRQLERELNLVRDMLESDKTAAVAPAAPVVPVADEAESVDTQSEYSSENPEVKTV